MQRKVPHVLSLADFIGWRFGWVAKTYVMLFVVFNMSIAMLAEYSTIGSLFQDYLGACEHSHTCFGGHLRTAPHSAVQQ